MESVKPPLQIPPTPLYNLSTRDPQNAKESWVNIVQCNAAFKLASAKHILTFIYFPTLYDILYYFTIYGTTLQYLVLLNYTSVFVTYFFGQIESVRKQMKM